MNPVNPERIIRLALLLYAPMIASGVFSRAPGTLAAADFPRLLAGLAGAALLGMLTVALSRRVARRTRWGRALQLEFRGVLGELGSHHILALSLLSAFGEEILFRGVLHPRLGLLPAAVLFAGLHFPYRRSLIPWCAFAFAMGLALGLMTDLFRTLWPAILLHFLVNYLNLHDLTHRNPALDEGE